MAFLITSTITTLLYGKLPVRPVRPQAVLHVRDRALHRAGPRSAVSRSRCTSSPRSAPSRVSAQAACSLSRSRSSVTWSACERARYQGYFLAVFGTVSCSSARSLADSLPARPPFLGVTGWRWIFYINVPIGPVALVVVSRCCRRRDQAPSPHRLARCRPSPSSHCFCCRPSRSKAARGAGTPVALLLRYFIGVVGIMLFFLAERSYGEDALLLLRMFRNKTFRIGGLSSIVIGMGMFGGLLMLPQYLQVVKGMSPTMAGLGTLPMTIGMYERLDHLRLRRSPDRALPHLPRRRHRLARHGDGASSTSSARRRRCAEVMIVMVVFGLGSRRQHAADHPGGAERRSPREHRCRDLVRHPSPGR